MLDVDAFAVVLTTLAVAIAFLLFSKKGSSSSSNNRNGEEDGKRYPPSLPSLPIVGSLPFVFGGMDALPEFFMKTNEKLGPVFSFYIGSRLAVILNGKEAISDAMLKHGEAFADKPGLWTEANVLNKDLRVNRELAYGVTEKLSDAMLKHGEAFADKPGLWTETNVLNKDLRGLAFTHYNELFKKYHKLSLIILKELGFGATQVAEERILLQATDLFEEIRGHNGRPFNPKTFIMNAVSKVIISVLFGPRFLTTGKGCRMIIDTATEYGENMDPSIDMAPLLRFLPMYRKKIATMVRCHDEMLKGIEEGVELNKLPDAETSFVGRFFEDQGPGYNHQDLLYILRDLCLGGSDTVILTLLWGIVELANHDAVQSRMRLEVDQVIPRDRYPSLDDKTQLPYTEAVILELMRRHTVGPLATPHQTLKDTTTSGYFIPGGSLVMENIYGVHMDPQTWKDPENFRPERFLDEDNTVVGKDRIIPFGVGRRSCIAEQLGRQEIFLFLISLVQRFEILPPEGQDSIQVREVRGMTIPPSHFDVRLIPRLEGKFPE